MATEPVVEPVVEPVEPVVEPTEPVKAKDVKPVEPVSVVPEKYELTIPEESFLDSSITDEIAATAKERGLSNEDAQTMLEDRSKAVASHIDGLEKALDKTHAEWEKEVKDDPNLGGDNYTETGELTFRAGQFLGEEFVKTMESTGLGKNIAIVRAMRKLGKAIGDDKLILSKSKEGGEKKITIDDFYDHPTSQKEKASG